MRINDQVIYIGTSERILDLQNSGIRLYCYKIMRGSKYFKARVNIGKKVSNKQAVPTFSVDKDLVIPIKQYRKNRIKQILK
jgi:hypothetical protein